MITIAQYSKGERREWNEFLDDSKNGLFLFNRNYMEYHSNRFVDLSLMFYEGNKLIALLPANITDNILISHEGLTFGGFIINSKMNTSLMLTVFDELKQYLSQRHIDKLVYKCIPHTYHSKPSEEDRYALFRHNAKLIRREVTTTVQLTDEVKFQSIRRRQIKKAESAAMKTKQVNDFEFFWKILEENLRKTYDTKPAHSLAEIEYLQSKFPDNIRLFASYVGGIMLAGVVIYESNHVAHAQYIASSDKDTNGGSLDVLFAYLINDYYKGKKKYFDFGISTEKGGRFLNKGLIFFKEGFGASAVVHDIYEIHT